MQANRQGKTKGNTNHDPGPKNRLSLDGSKKFQLALPADPANGQVIEGQKTGRLGAIRDDLEWLGVLT